MTKQFFIADTHFGHEAIIGFENRPFQTAAQMDQQLIENWNRTVGPEDRVYLLGDFALADENRIKELIKLLTGYKILVMGNHDRRYSHSWWQEAGFDMVSAYPILVEDWLLLSHEPLYVNTNMPYINIFGHVHGNPQYRTSSRQHFCVSCERINYTPLELAEMMGKIRA